MSYKKLPNSEEGENISEDSSDKATEEDAKNCKIDKTIIIYRSFFFLFFFGFGTCFPYMGIYFKQLGLSAGYVGLLAGLRPLIQFLSGPLWAMLGDKYKARKLILAISIFAWLVMTLLLVVPQPQNTKCVIVNGTESVAFQVETQTELHQIGYVPNYAQDQPQIYQPVSVKNSEFSVPAKDLETNLEEKEHTQRYKIIHDNDELFKIFFILLILIVVGEFLESPSFIMIDAALLQHLGTKRTNYGKTRMFGSMGYGLASFLAGVALDRMRYTYCAKSMTNYSVMFYLFAFFMLIALVFVVFLFDFQYSDSSQKKRNPTEVYNLFLSLKYGTFLIITWFLGFSHGAIDSFLNWFLEDLGASKTMMGTATGFRACAIISSFFFSGFIISRVGHVQVVRLSLISYMLCFFAYTMLPGPWWAIPVEVFQGVTFAISWATCVTYLTAASPEDGIATMQGLLQGVYWGIGSGAGAMVAGLCVSRFGVVRSFRGGGVTCGIIIIIFEVVQFILRRKDKEVV